MKKYFKFAVIVILIFTSLAQSQQITAKKKPNKYDVPKQYNDFAIVSDQERSENQAFEVYCSVEGAKTYTDLNSRQAFKTLNYFDKFFICEEDREYARIYKSEDFNSNNFQLINPVDYGWIEKKYLLLSRHCVASDEMGGVNRKAMIINKKEHLKIKDSDDKADLIVFRKGPGVNFDKTGKDSPLFNFFFVFQKTIVNNSTNGKSEEWYLLGKSERFTEWKKEDVVFGWAPGNRLVEWDKRVVLEPNWEEAAVKERKSGIKAAFFYEPEDMKNYLESGQMGVNYIWKERNVDKEVGWRPNGEWRRFALLESDARELNKNEIRAGIPGEIEANNVKLLDDIEFSDTAKKIVEGAKPSNNVNIIFVLDGTKSMEPYFPAVSKALSNAINILSKYYENIGSDIKFGVAVYRDAEEGSDKEFELLPLSKNSDMVGQWLNNTRDRIYHNRDITYDEDLLPGLERTLMDMDINANETNLMILLGDAGSHDKDKYRINKISELLVKYDFRFLAFKVNKYKEIAQKFEQQLIELGNMYAQSLYNIDKNTPELQHIKKEEYRVEYDPDKNYQNIVAKDATREFRIYNNDEGQFDNIDSLVSEITNYVKDIKLTAEVMQRATEAIRDGRTIEEVLADIESYGLKSSNKYSDSFGPGMYRYINGLGITTKENKFLKTGEKYQLYEPGISVDKVKGQKYNLFKKLLFVSNREVIDLLSNIEDLVDNCEKEDLYNFMYTYANLYYGEKESKADISQMPVEVLLKRIYGIANQNSLLAKYKIDEIKDLTNQEFKNIMKDVEEKYEELQALANNENYTYSFEVSEIRYFWIPEDVLP
ncbi:MAG: hypothetical protein JXR48_00190 [Candidatus Delongbacteria bacterium]|nr:hypothetical protein [Candidatus Delongbacteria bacterium]